MAGFDSEGTQFTFDLFKLAQNILYFYHLEMQNSVINITVDFAYHINWRMVIEHALTCALFPQE